MSVIKKLGCTVFAIGFLFNVTFASLTSFAENRGISESGTNSLQKSDYLKYSEIQEKEVINFNTIKRVNRNLAPGETVLVRGGEVGEKSVTYTVEFENGKEVSRRKVSETVVKYPVDKIVEYGSADGQLYYKEDSVPFSYREVITCKATAYTYESVKDAGYGGITATGLSLEKGIIAVDPKVIPLGARVYIESLDGSWVYGFAVAADTGGAIKGNKIDLCFDTLQECYSFGVRNCRVYILN